MHTFYSGKNGKITVDGVTKRIVRIGIHLLCEKIIVTASDSPVIERGDGPLDASIDIEIADSDDAGGGTLASTGALVLSRAAPSALSFTDDATTPASRVPANFWVVFPLANWRVDDATGGSGGATDRATTMLKLTPSNRSNTPSS